MYKDIKYSNISSIDELDILNIPYDILNKEINLNNIDKYKNEINNFINLIFTIEPKENLKLLINNINTLKIKKNSLIPFSIYHYDKNTIIINNNSSLEHELFHMASTYAYNNKKASGFTMHTKDNYYIGNSLTEGYTELLTQTYFPNNSIAYEEEMIYTQCLTDLLGRDKMDNLYFNANIVGLIEELSKYSSEKEAIEFIKNFDIASYNQYMYYQVNEYLIKLNIKMLLEYNYDNEYIYEYVKEKALNLIYPFFNEEKFNNFYNEIYRNEVNKKSL